ncbi:hypothetical protein [Actinoallomurus iriomotensis]|uniref:Uncharacterized protein n=1 Tax=Actinoallomurus iriomotensis TaxID=478107 RepID=A0A9W6VVR9_9ACTN|nr:hypothetical protein [Actinoallomurus iriomotensis]GLY80857.1 hypothetical protein Airi01_091240 [Actinoallomurus iriomotensis]
MGAGAGEGFGHCHERILGGLMPAAGASGRSWPDVDLCRAAAEAHDAGMAKARRQVPQFVKDRIARQATRESNEQRHGERDLVPIIGSSGLKPFR